MKDESTNNVDEKLTATRLRKMSEEKQKEVENDKNYEKKMNNDEKKNWMKKNEMKDDENHGKKMQMKLSNAVK